MGSTTHFGSGAGSIGSPEQVEPPPGHRLQDRGLVRGAEDGSLKGGQALQLPLDFLAGRESWASTLPAPEDRPSTTISPARGASPAGPSPRTTSRSAATISPRSSRRSSGGIRGGEFQMAAKDDWACQWCDFNGICPTARFQQIRAEGRRHGGEAIPGDARPEVTFTPIDQETREQIRTDLATSSVRGGGAGTGKTTSLVESDRRAPRTGTATADSIVVITFTGEAAARALNRGSATSSARPPSASPTPSAASAWSRRARLCTAPTSRRSTRSQRHCFMSDPSKPASIRSSRC